MIYCFLEVSEIKEIQKLAIDSRLYFCMYH